MHFVCVSYVCTHIYLYTYIPQSTCGDQRISCWGLFFPSTLGYGGINLRSLVWLAGAFATETSHRLSAQFSTTER